jgi:ferrous iron transport protein B
MASFGPPTAMSNIENEYELLIGKSPEQKDSLEKVKNGLLLESSFAGIIGKTIEPVIKPMGYDWKLGIGILTSFAAREVFVGTMATIYSLDGEPEDSKLLLDRMRAEINKDTGKPLYGVPVILSLLIFFAFAMQCFSTLAVLYKETGSIKWPIIQFTVMSGLAYFLSIIVFQLSQ